MNHFLLTTESNAQYVSEFTENEMKECFTAQQRADLADGLVVEKRTVRYVIRYVDMVAAARAKL